MMRCSYLFAALLVPTIAGCVATSRSDWTQPEAIRCTSEKQCEAMWSKAQAFVARNSDFKVQVSSSSLIQTFGPTRNNPGLAFVVTKEIDQTGSGWIQLRAACGNSFGCIPSVGDAGRRFTAYVTQ